MVRVRVRARVVVRVRVRLRPRVSVSACAIRVNTLKHAQNFLLRCVVEVRGMLPDIRQCLVCTLLEAQDQKHTTRHKATGLLRGGAEQPPLICPDVPLTCLFYTY